VLRDGCKVVVFGATFDTGDRGQVVLFTTPHFTTSPHYFTSLQATDPNLSSLNPNLDPLSTTHPAPYQRRPCV